MICLNQPNETKKLSGDNWGVVVPPIDPRRLFDSGYRPPIRQSDPEQKKYSRKQPKFQKELVSGILKKEENSYLKNRFTKLAQKWEQETCGFSSITKKITNLNYLKIIALGKIVVPFILESLQAKPDHWFLALKALTDEDPTQRGDNFEQAVEAWLNWGKQKGFIR